MTETRMNFKYKLVINFKNIIKLFIKSQETIYLSYYIFTLYVILPLFRVTTNLIPLQFSSRKLLSNFLRTHKRFDLQIFLSLNVGT